MGPLTRPPLEFQHAARAPAVAAPIPVAPIVPEAERVNAGVVVPIPTFPFAMTSSMSAPVLDATARAMGAVEVPTTESLAMGVVLPNPVSPPFVMVIAVEYPLV